MKLISLFVPFFFLGISLTAQQFTVNVAVAKNTTAGTGELDANGNPLKGSDFVLSGIVYSSDYFETHCPDNMNCGVSLVQNINSIYAAPEHPAEAIGRWDLNAFTIRDITDALQNGGTPTFSTQSFTFKKDFEHCPGCVIVTEGKDQFGNMDNMWFKRAISGGTTEGFRLIRGETEQIILKQPENINITGGYNLIVTFYYEKD
jgi:hypothetical protein